MTLLRDSTPGFTLVELAVALTIIGLLLGGVLQGKTVLENARVKSTIKRHSEYSSAVTAFRDKYFQFPGDMVNATQRLPNCTPANNCANGDGNGRIGRQAPASIVSDDSTVDSTVHALETAQFWKHLALTDMITGINVSAPVGGANNTWGETHPSSPLKGGIFVGSARNIGALLFSTADVGRPYFIFAGALSSPPPGLAPVPSLTPRMALQIDRQADDGDPLRGDVYVLGSVPRCSTVMGSNDVDPSATADLCALAMKYR